MRIRTGNDIFNVCHAICLYFCLTRHPRVVCPRSLILRPVPSSSKGVNSSTRHLDQCQIIVQYACGPHVSNAPKFLILALRKSWRLMDVHAPTDRRLGRCRLSPFPKTVSFKDTSRKHLCHYTMVGASTQVSLFSWSMFMKDVWLRCQATAHAAFGQHTLWLCVNGIACLLRRFDE